MLILGFGFLNCLKKFDDFLELRRQLFDGLQGDGGGSGRRGGENGLLCGNSLNRDVLEEEESVRGFCGVQEWSGGVVKEEGGDGNFGGN